MSAFNYVNGLLQGDDVSLLHIAKEVGTPCYVYSHASLVEQWNRFNSAFQDHPHHIFYAVKANSNIAVLNTLAALGSGFDIVSVGELARVLAAKGDPQKIVFSGVGKQPKEIEEALKKSIDIIKS